MSVAAVMLVKDEADIIEPIIRHLLTQVDHVYVNDNLSSDGTEEILHSLLLETDQLTVSLDTTVGYWQAAKTTALAQRAFRGGHDWVIPCDADEFWYSPFGRISDILLEMPPEALFIRAPLYNHITTSEDPPKLNPIERIGWRIREPGELPKVACRASPDLEIGMGNHDATTSGRIHSERAHSLLGELTIRHFPWRTPEQFLRKITNGSRAYAAAAGIPENFGEHWKMFGMPEDEGFEDRVRAWFHDWGYHPNPTADPALIYDPATTEAIVG